MGGGRGTGPTRRLLGACLLEVRALLFLNHTDRVNERRAENRRARGSNHANVTILAHDVPARCTHAGSIGTRSIGTAASIAQSRRGCSCSVSGPRDCGRVICASVVRVGMAGRAGGGAHEMPSRKPNLGTRLKPTPIMRGANPDSDARTGEFLNTAVACARRGGLSRPGA